MAFERHSEHTEQTDSVSASASASASALKKRTGSRGGVPSGVPSGNGRISAAWRDRLIVIGIVLTSLNLRPAVTSLGVLMEDVRDDLGMSGAVAGALTSVPVICFAVFGVMAPRLARRFGPNGVVGVGMAAVAVGLLIRPYTGSTAGLLAASALALMGIAVGNILLPVIVKRSFPDRVGSMTGLYSMVMALGTSLAAAVTVPITDELGGNWQSGLVVWAAPAVVAVLPWLPVMVARRGAGRDADVALDAEAGAEAVPSDKSAEAGASVPDAPAPRITRSPTAWALAVFFGLQSTAAYVAMGWMPQIFIDAGVSDGTAGLLLGYTMLLGMPFGYVIPRVAVRMRSQGSLVIALGAFGVAGYAGLYFAPAGGAWVWATFAGISNCAFPLALTLVGMRARTGTGVAQLSAFSQSAGYLLSIPGPLLVGVLYQSSGGWGVPLALMTALLVPQVVAGVLAGRNRTVEDETAGTPATAA